jgi:DNA primase
VPGVFDELAARMDYHALFSEYLRLRKKGNRFFAVCPFHQEKDASLSVDITTGLWHCFGCKEGGNMFQFIAKIEQLEMREVVEMLVQRYGVDLKQYQTAEEREKLGRRQILLRIMKAAAAFYRKQLTTTSHGQRALEYFHGRGLTDATINTFGLGVTPLDADGLTKALQERNVRTQDLLDLNISIEGRRGELIDMMRGRAVFPLFDHRGDVVGIAGRAMGDEEPKYLNTRNTPLYNKSRLLYGFNLARKAITAEDAVFVVEGYMDVISLHQAGVVNCVAACGTALTAEHVQMLARQTDKFYLAFDGDSAGIGAALRSCDTFMQVGHYPRVIIIPGGKDPDDVAREGGKEAVEKLRAKAITFPRLLTAVRIKTREPEPMEIKRVLTEAAPIFAHITDQSVINAFARDLSSALKLPEKQARDMLVAAARPGGGKIPTPMLDSRSPRERFLMQLIAALLADEELRAQVKPMLKLEDFPKGHYRELYKRLVVGGEDCTSPDFPPELASLCAEARQSFIAGDYTAQAYAAKVKAFRLEEVSARIREMQREMARAADENDAEASAKLSEKMQLLLKARAKLAAEIKAAGKPEVK